MSWNAAPRNGPSVPSDGGGAVLYATSQHPSSAGLSAGRAAGLRASSSHSARSIRARRPAATGPSRPEGPSASPIAASTRRLAAAASAGPTPARPASRPPRCGGPGGCRAAPARPPGRRALRGPAA